MFTINTFSLSQLNNAEVTAFYINLKKAIENATAEGLGLTAVNTAFQATLQKLINQVYNTTGSEYTAAMQAADFKRDQIFKRIRLRLQLVEVADDSEDLTAIKDVVVAHLLKQYGSNIPMMPYQEESAIIQGFIHDLNDKLDAEARQTLGISQDVNNLEQANEEFISYYSSRTTEKASGDTGLTLKLRAEMSEHYQQICFTVQYLANSTDETLADKTTACQSFIGVLNVILADVKRRYNQRISGASTAEGESTSGEGESTSGEGESSTGSGESTSGSGESSTSGSSSDSGSSSTDSGSSSSSSSSSSGMNGSASEEGVVNGGALEF